MKIRNITSKPIFLFLSVLILLITGCENAGTTTETQLLLQSTGITDTGKMPYVVVQNQATDGKTVVVAEAFSIGPGWISIHDQENGQIGPVIGFSHVANGVNQDVTVQIDPSKVTGVMYAMLHKDEGKIGVYEGPMTDPPVMIDGQMISPSFSTTGGTVLSTGTMSETLQSTPQSTGNMGGMPASSVTQTPGTSMVITNTATPEPGMTMVMTSTSGTNISEGGMVEVTVPPGGLSPDISVSNQPVMDGLVRIDKVVSIGPGWVAIFNEQNGQPNALIGYAHLDNGETRNLMVKVNTSQVTPNLYAFLQIDAGKIGTYEFPGPDALVHLGVRMIQTMFSTVSGQTATAMPGSMATPASTAAPSPTPDIVPVVKVSNQEIRGGTVIIDQVICKGPGWIGIHITNPDGSLGAPIGYARVNDGDNRNVLIHINVSIASKTMVAMLHVDAGRIGILEFPGTDQPYMYKGQMVMTPFNITSGLLGQVVNVNVSNTQTPHLVDGMGMSLYISTGDAPGKSNCTGDCSNSWLPLLATGKLEPGDGVDVSKISVILLPNGLKQVTYGGFPLYYYAGDGQVNDIKGQGVDGQWFLSTP